MRQKIVTLGKDPKLSELIAWAQQNGLEIQISIDRPAIKLTPKSEDTDPEKKEERKKKP